MYRWLVPAALFLVLGVAGCQSASSQGAAPPPASSSASSSAASPSVDLTMYELQDQTAEDDSFDDGKGYMEECADGTYSMSGGRDGVCTDHGGPSRPVYQG